MSFDRQKFSHATTPSDQTVVKRASYVMINQTGSYAFSYTSGSSDVSNATHTYFTGSANIGEKVVNNAAASNLSPYKIDINPIAWKRTDKVGKVGEVTFVYVRRG